MSFSLSGSTITQSGTDTSLAGLSAIAGVVTRVEGSGTFIKTRYYLPASTGLTYATLSWDGRYECLIFGTGAPIMQAATSASVLTIGVAITQFGGTYSHNSEALIFTDNSGNAYQVNQGFKILTGTFNWYSGIIRLQSCSAIGGSDYRNGGAVGTLKGYIGPYATIEMMAVPSGQTNESCQIQIACDPSFVINGLTVKGYLTSPPTVLISLASATVYTTPFVFNLQGAGGITPQSDTRTTVFATFYGLQTNASPKGLNWFLGSLIRGVNQILGSAVVCTEHNVDANHCQGYAELRNEVDATFKTVAGAAIPGAVVYCRDTNNGKRQIYNLNGVNINNTADKVYLGATDAAGNVKFTGVAGSVLLAAVVRNTTGTVVSVDDFGLNAKDYRSLSGTKGTDDFRFYYWGYGFLPQDSIEILKSDKVAKFLAKTLLSDANVTLTEAAAVAKLASSFSVAGNVLTVTASSTIDDIYDVMKAYKTRPIQAQVEYPTIGTQPVTASGTQLATAMSIVVNAGATLTAGSKFKSIACAGVTLLGSATAISIAGNVTQATPTDLTGVSITGTLTYNTASTAQFTFTNSTLGTVTNSGAGIVTVKRINSTLTAGTNVVAYLPTTLNFTLNGGRIRVLNHLGVEQFNQTADGSFELPVSATGTWSYKIAKYGSKAIENTFSIDGTTKAITPAYIPDTFVVDTLANVAAYTSLQTTQKIYDYYSYYLASAAGILVTKTVNLTASLLDLGAYTLANSAVGISGSVISINTTTISGVDVLTTGNQNGVNPTSPQRITDSVATLTWVNTILSGGRIRILNQLGVEQYNQTTDATILLPKASTGTWTYKIVKYGSQPITGSFSVDGVFKTIAPSYIPDTFIFDALANVISYTSLETTQKIYDYYSYFLTSATGILVTKTLILTANKLDLGAFSIANSALGVGTSIIGINSATVSGVNIVTTSTQSGISPTYPQLITDATTTTNWLNLTLNGGRIRILNNLGVEQFNQTASVIILLPTTSTGTWTYKIAKYGSQAITGTFNIDGTIKIISAAYIPDTATFDSLANVQAYTALETSQKIYDYYSLYLASASGISSTKSVFLTSTSLDLGASNLAAGALSVSSVSINTNSSTISGVNIITLGSIDAFTPIYPQQLTSSAGITNWLKVTLAAGQVFRDTFNNTFLTASTTTLLPASFTQAISIFVTRRGYKKQSVTIPYSTNLLSAQAFTLIPDSNVVDLVSDLSASNLTTSQLIYDAFSQYQSSSPGILDLYTPTKSPGSIDFSTKGFSLVAVTDFSQSPLSLKSTSLTGDAYYSSQAFTKGSATLANSVLIRSSNLNSEIIFTPDALTFYPTATDRNSGTNPGLSVTGGVYRFLYGSVVSGVNLSGTIYLRVTVGGLIFFADLPISSGANVMDLGVQGQLTAISAKLDTKPSKAEIPALVWDEATSTHVTAGSFGVDAKAIKSLANLIPATL